MSNQEEQGFILVTLQGKIVESTLNYTKNGDPYCKGKVAIPFMAQDDTIKHKFYSFIVWRDLAEIIAEIPEDTMVKMEGDLRISSYDGNCSDCGSTMKKYWTDIVISSVDLV